MPIWPFVCFFIYLVLVEVFINLRVNKLQHAIRALILANTKSFEQGEEIFKNYRSTGLKQLVKPPPENAPDYLIQALNQRRRTMGLRLVLFVIGVIGVAVWVALL